MGADGVRLWREYPKPVGMGNRAHDRAALRFSRGGFARQHIGAADAVFASGIFFRGGAEAVEAGRHAHIFKAQVAQISNQLRLRQSAGDSTRPQVNVSARVLIESGVEHNIGKLQPTARTQHAADFGKGFFFFRNEVEHAI